MSFTDFLGLIGVVAVSIAFFLLQAQKLSAHGATYLLLNLLGAILVMVSLWYSWNLSSFVIELIWAVVSIYGLWKLRQNKSG